MADNQVSLDKLIDEMHSNEDNQISHHLFSNQMESNYQMQIPIQNSIMSMDPLKK